jgi:hypothetical protein
MNCLVFDGASARFCSSGNHDCDFLIQRVGRLSITGAKRLIEHSE